MSKTDFSINSLHGVDLIDSEIAADALSQIPLGPGFGLGFLEEPAAHLLVLIDQKCHHHHNCKDTTEILFTQPVIVSKDYLLSSLIVVCTKEECTKEEC
jgi:hypothetical protein